MTVKVFILGRPGSGKSRAARYIAELVENKGYSSVHINDYAILEKMFMADIEGKSFSPADNGGFDVIDFTVLDVALKKVKRIAQKHVASAKVDLMIIEFARDEYSKPLKIFNPDLLHDAYILFLDADLDTCVKRVYERTAHPATPDDHYTSDKIIKRYYYVDNKLYIKSKLAKDFSIDSKRLKIIDNMDSLQDFLKKISEFVELIFELEKYHLRETDPVQIIPTIVTESELAE